MILIQQMDMLRNSYFYRFFNNISTLLKTLCKTFSDVLFHKNVSLND